MTTLLMVITLVWLGMAGWCVYKQRTGKRAALSLFLMPGLWLILMMADIISFSAMHIPIIIPIAAGIILFSAFCTSFLSAVISFSKWDRGEMTL